VEQKTSTFLVKQLKWSKNTSTFHFSSETVEVEQKHIHFSSETLEVEQKKQKCNKRSYVPCGFAPLY
jgi:uncharacterized protein (DUF952 family)